MNKQLNFWELLSEEDKRLLIEIDKRIKKYVLKCIEKTVKG